jgi:hypothetical protein
MRTTLRPRVVVALSLAAVVVAACVVSTTTRRVSIEASAPAQRVITPLKVHLRDGALIIFPDGAMISATDVSGSGRRYDVARSFGAPEATISISRDSVLAFETYERKVNPGRTLVYGPLSLAASTVAVAALSVVIFGSCPTIYADSAGVQVLQAESFSNSIAPLLARRDLDRLIVAPDAAGIVRLDVRNEALETHYIDHLELVEFRHRADEMAILGSPGGVIAVSDLVAPASVRDAAGREVRDMVVADDDLAFGTDDAFLTRAIAGGPIEDHLDVTVPRPRGGDTLVLVLRVRTSLLATSILYDYMLGRPGVSALDWMGQDLARITRLAKLATWYGGNFGLHASMQVGDNWKPIARMINFGPTAWRSIGVIIPPSRSDSARIRLTFLADAFRIDRIAIAHRVRRLESRAIPITRLTDAEGRPRADAAATLRRADGTDLETHPGDRFHAEFDVGRAPGVSRTFMLGAEGYYTEWIRESWVRAATDSVPFSTSRTPIREMLKSWRASKDSLERNFYIRRVPIV